PPRPPPRVGPARGSGYERSSRHGVEKRARAHACRRLKRKNSRFWSARLSYKNGAPEEIRTPDPQIRSLVLYPAELRARFSLGLVGLTGPMHPSVVRKRRERAL